MRGLPKKPRHSDGRVWLLQTPQFIQVFLDLNAAGIPLVDSSRLRRIEQMRLLFGHGRG